MKKLFEKILDFFYLISDYIWIVTILIIIGLTVEWRLNTLFKEVAKANDEGKVAIINPNEENSLSWNDEVEKNDNNKINEKKDIEVANIDDTSNENSLGKNDEKIDEVEEEKSQKNINSKNEENINSNNQSNNNTITVNVPEGYMSHQIAKLLVEKGLINNSNEFISKSKELDLDTRLQSGEFKIRKDYSLERIVRVIARKSM